MTKVGIVGGLCNTSRSLVIEEILIRGAVGKAVPVIKPMSGLPAATDPTRVPVLPQGRPD